MNLSVQWDIKDLLQAADRMAVQKHLPEFIAKTVAVSMRDMAENKARDKLGKGKFASEIAAGIRVKADGMTVTLDHASNDTNHLAEHVHEGGPVKSGNGKMLAIPIDKSVRGEWASVHRWNTPDGKPLFLRKKEDGPRGRAYLAEPRGKQAKPKVLYVLTKETKPQRARPWWPTDEDFLRIAEREIEWWRDQHLPAEI